MKHTRRKFLQNFALSSAVVAMPFQLRLANASGNEFELIAEAFKYPLYGEGGPESDLWGYNKSSPGPEIRVKRGERVKVKLVNKLDVPTTIHWHGIRIANNMDGVSGLTQEPVMPGSSFIYDFTVPDAGTFWYHAHHQSWQQVARGLYGPLIVDEDSETFDRAHDLTLVLDDWRLDRQGVLQVDSLGALMDWSHAGRLGNWLTVNGTSNPKFSLNANEPYRLRLINACNSRALEIDPGRFDARLMAFDGMAFQEPEFLEYGPLTISPSQRVDLLVVPQEGKDFVIEEVTSDQNLPIANFSVNNNAGSPDMPVPVLPASNLPEPDVKNGRKITVGLTGGAMGNFEGIVYKGKKLSGDEFQQTKQFWAMNGVANLTEKPLFSARKGETIIIETTNDTAFFHAMHIHGHHFKVLIGADEGRWRDTFFVDRTQKTTIAFVADNPGKWLFHCHMLEHAAAGMSSWFEVV